LPVDLNLVHQLDPTLHEKSRLSIATALTENRVLSFIELKKLLRMTDGNLCLHIRSLQRQGYLQVNKSIDRGKVKTTCRLSDRGIKALHQYLRSLEEISRNIRRCLRRRPAH
jgi:DNA-binding PadR family transcriptional regulator